MKLVDDAVSEDDAVFEDDALFEDDRRADTRRRGATVRMITAGNAVFALVAVLVVLPLLGFGYPHSRIIVAELAGPSDAVLRIFAITPVLSAVAALAVVALLRALPYGVGAVISLTVGAALTTAAVRAWAAGWVPASALPNGHVTACAALVGAATLVVGSRYLPMVWGLGTVVVATVAAAAVIGGSATVVGVVTTALIVATWWAMASAVMLYSPVAAAREARNPLDTAALAVQRRMG